MGIDYRPDKDLEFLQYCSEDDIRLLAEYLTKDKDGEERYASQISGHEDFKQRYGQPDKWSKSWRLVAGELQHFGGDSLVNLFRRSGVFYREILCDVCDKLKVSYDKKKTAYDIENALIEKMVTLAWEKMSEEERQKTLDAFNVSSLGIGAFDLVLLAIKAGGSGSLKGAQLMAESAKVIFSGLSMMSAGAIGSIVATRSVALLSGPLALVFAAFAIPQITGVAYRVTMPAVIQIAYMRREYEKKDRF